MNKLDIYDTNFYKANGTFKTTINGVKYVPLIDIDKTNDKTIASSIHKRVRQDVIRELYVGQSLLDIANLVENQIRKYSASTEINKGIGFPVGVSINDCAAHYTCKVNDKTKTIGKDDVLKIDIGVHSNGFIIDSAFTVTFSDKYDKLLEAGKDATWTGLKNIGIDQDIAEWGDKINEVIKSYEIDLDDKKYQLKPIYSLGGHNILPWTIHGGTFLPAHRNEGLYVKRFNEGIYAVETFVTTGSGNISSDDNYITHYSVNNNFNEDLGYKNLTLFYNNLKRKFNGLPFCDKWVSDITNYEPYLKILSRKGAVKTYPPLYDIKESHVVQYEHTVEITAKGKDILSDNGDY